MSGSSPVCRRTLFGLAGGSLLAGQLPLSLESASVSGPAAIPTTSMVFGQPRQGGPLLHVAGPRDGVLAEWARRLVVPMAAGLEGGKPNRERLALLYGGGGDGVTMANQFDARAAPDGQSALLFPGSVATDWLAGPGLVRLDPSRMLPVLAAVGPCVLMVRGGLVTGRKLRLATGTDRHAALTALLGLDLAGIPAKPVAPGIDKEQAARGGAADAVFLHGPTAAAQAARLAGAGFTPAFATGTGLDGVALRAPHFLSAMKPARVAGDPLVEAWRALAAASALCAVMVVPRLSPAESIGRWRHAARLGMVDAPVADHARRQAMVLVADSGAVDAFSPMRAAEGTQRALHRWMAGRAAVRRG